jgi:hypothetical protein
MEFAPVSNGRAAILSRGNVDWLLTGKCGIARATPHSLEINIPMNNRTISLPLT